MTLEEQVKMLREAMFNLVIWARWARKRAGVSMDMPNSGALSAAEDLLHALAATAEPATLVAMADCRACDGTGWTRGQSLVGCKVCGANAEPAPPEPHPWPEVREDAPRFSREWCATVAEHERTAEPSPSEFSAAPPPRCEVACAQCEETARDIHEAVQDEIDYAEGEAPT